MNNPLTWLLEEQLPTLLTAEQMDELRTAYAAYQLDYGRWYRANGRRGLLQHRLQKATTSEERAKLERRIIAEDRSSYARKHRPTGTMRVLDRVHHFFAPLQLTFVRDADGLIREDTTGRLVVEFRRATLTREYALVATWDGSTDPDATAELLVPTHDGLKPQRAAVATFIPVRAPQP